MTGERIVGDCHNGNFKREALKSEGQGFVDLVYCNKCKEVFIVRMDNFDYVKKGLEVGK